MSVGAAPAKRHHDEPPLEEFFPRLPTGLPEAHRPFAVQIETARFAQGTTVVNLALLELGAEAAVYTIDVYARSDDTVVLTVERGSSAPMNPSASRSS